jgi:hypothetical protein
MVGRRGTTDMILLWARENQTKKAHNHSPADSKWMVTSDINILIATNNDKYQQLYNKESTDNIKLRLSNKERNTCKAPLTLHELISAVNMMHNNKSPGKDGLSVEFYETFWHKLGPPLKEVVNWNYMIEQMSPSQSKALLKLL